MLSSRNSSKIQYVSLYGVEGGLFFLLRSRQIKFDMVLQRCREAEQLAPELEDRTALEEAQQAQRSLQEKIIVNDTCVWTRNKVFLANIGGQAQWAKSNFWQI